MPWPNTTASASRSKHAVPGWKRMFSLLFYLHGNGHVPFVQNSNLLVTHLFSIFKCHSLRPLSLPWTNNYEWCRGKTDRELQPRPLLLQGITRARFGGAYFPLRSRLAIKPGLFALFRTEASLHAFTTHVDTRFQHHLCAWIGRKWWLKKGLSNTPNNKPRVRRSGHYVEWVSHQYRNVWLILHRGYNKSWYILNSLELVYYHRISSEYV